MTRSVKPPPNRCGEWEPHLPLFLEGDLPAREAARVDAHLAECQGCRDFLNELARSQRALKRLRLEDIEPAAYETVRARVLERSAEDQRRRETLSGWSWAAAAALILAVTGWLVVAISLPDRRHAADRNTTQSVPRSLPASPPTVAPVASSVGAAPSRTSGGVGSTPAATAKRDEAPRIGAVLPRATALSREKPNDSKPRLIKLLTDDPDIVIYWLLDEDGGDP